VPAESFTSSLQSWRDFYVTVAEATAALLGLLFVGVSIRLSAVSATQRPDQRTRAALAFGNLVSAMVLSLLVLIPGTDARTMALQIGLIAAILTVRIGRRAMELRRAWSRLSKPFATARRLAWAGTAIVMLLYTAVGLWTDGSAGYLYGLLASVFIFLVGAADVAWDLLMNDEVTG
jgi:hypothetical protein